MPGVCCQSDVMRLTARPASRVPVHVLILAFEADWSPSRSYLVEVPVAYE